jgi:hypothetical protein
MIRKLTTAGAAFGALLLVSTAANAAPIAPTALEFPTVTQQVADGCGPAGWRGPGGACHWPRYAWGWGRDCPPGWWRGPWGHCRDTPYHGRLPGGGWKP